MDTNQQSIKAFFDNIPLLHTWDGGNSWNAGGFKSVQLNYFLDLAVSISDCEVIETGSGNSTISFLLANPKKLVSISPQSDLWLRIKNYCEKNEISMKNLESVIGKSEWELPKLASEKNEYDIGLMDGCHGWPTTFIDLYYIYYMLRIDGYLIIDDIQLHSVKEIANFLISESTKFELVANFGKTLVFKKLTHDLELGEWNHQKYIIDKTNEARDSGNEFVLHKVASRDARNLKKGWRLIGNLLIFVIRACNWTLLRIRNSSVS